MRHHPLSGKSSPLISNPNLPCLSLKPFPLVLSPSTIHHQTSPVLAQLGAAALHRALLPGHPPPLAVGLCSLLWVTLLGCGRGPEGPPAAPTLSPITLRFWDCWKRCSFGALEVHCLHFLLPASIPRAPCSRPLCAGAVLCVCRSSPVVSVLPFPNGRPSLLGSALSSAFISAHGQECRECGSVLQPQHPGQHCKWLEGCAEEMDLELLGDAGLTVGQRCAQGPRRPTASWLCEQQCWQQSRRCRPSVRQRWGCAAVLSSVLGPPWGSRGECREGSGAWGGAAQCGGSG